MIKQQSIRDLKSLHAKTILVQVPEGLKTAVSRIVAELESEGFTPIVSVEPCFGACDLADAEAKMLGCDALLHIGHTDFWVKPKVPVVYDEYPSDFDPSGVLSKNFSNIGKYEKFGLLASAQYLDSLDKAKSFLKSKGKSAIYTGAGSLRPGQVLGCNQLAATKIEKDVDCFIFIGSGKFHYEGLISNLGKPVFFLDADSSRLLAVSADIGKIEIKRQLRIEKAKGLTRFAVFVSTKPGQAGVKSAMDARKHLLSRAKSVVIITAGMLSPEKITGMGIQAIVNTACPRMRDDQKLFGVVILNPEDAMEL